MGLLKRLIRKSYRALSVVNTADVVLSGNPVKIAKHLARKRTVKLGSHLVKHSKRR